MNETYMQPMCRLNVVMNLSPSLFIRYMNNRSTLFIFRKGKALHIHKCLIINLVFILYPSSYQCLKLHRV